MSEYLATFRIPIDKIPEAKNWKVGHRYKVVAEVEQTGVNKERDYSYGEDGPVSLSKRREKPRYKTMVEFKVCGVSAKDSAIKSRLK